MKYHALMLFKEAKAWETVDWNVLSGGFDEAIEDEKDLLNHNPNIQAWIITDANGVILAHSEPQEAQTA